MTAFPFSPFHFRLTLPLLLAAWLLLAGCSPSLNWRQVEGVDAPFAVLLPAKPTTLSRPIDLDGMQVTMSMTATEVDGVTFAVGVIALPDAALAPKALQAMKLALVRNINGSIESERVNNTSGSSIDIVATGTLGRSKETARLLAHFAARDQRVYQAIIVGPSSAVLAMSADAADTFFTSFKVH